MGREMAMDFDLASLPGSVSRRLDSMLTDSDFFEIPSASPVLSRPDEYEYTITVVAGNSIHTIRVSDTSMPESVRPLVEELNELAETAT